MSFSIQGCQIQNILTAVSPAGHSPILHEIIYFLGDELHWGQQQKVPQSIRKVFNRSSNGETEKPGHPVLCRNLHGVTSNRFSHSANVLHWQCALHWFYGAISHITVTVPLSIWGWAHWETDPLASVRGISHKPGGAHKPGGRGIGWSHVPPTQKSRPIRPHD